MEIFNVKQKEIDQVTKKEELKSTNPLKVNKINKQTNRQNNSFLDRINIKLEFLEAIERSTTIERKNDRDNRIDRFLDLYEKN